MCASVAEAEYATAFHSGQKAYFYRNVLEFLGYNPQLPPHLFMATTKLQLISAMMLVNYERIKRLTNLMIGSGIVAGLNLK
jgi:hypothetical protein